MTTFLANIDLKGSEMERPFMRGFVEADDAEQAALLAAAQIDATEVVRDVEPLQPILDRVTVGLAAGRAYGISWKSESGNLGPVTITDVDAAPADGVAVGIPFGSDPDWLICLPWMKRAEARRLAKYLGLTLEEW